MVSNNIMPSGNEGFAPSGPPDMMDAAKRGAEAREEMVKRLESGEEAVNDNKEVVEVREGVRKATELALFGVRPAAQRAVTERVAEGVENHIKRVKKNIAQGKKDIKKGVDKVKGFFGIKEAANDNVEKSGDDISNTA